MMTSLHVFGFAALKRELCAFLIALIISPPVVRYSKRTQKNLFGAGSRNETDGPHPFPAYSSFVCLLRALYIIVYVALMCVLRDYLNLCAQKAIQIFAQIQYSVCTDCRSVHSEYYIALCAESEENSVSRLLNQSGSLEVHIMKLYSHCRVYHIHLICDKFESFRENGKVQGSNSEKIISVGKLTYLHKSMAD